jgi:hypothetical protein
MGHTACTNPQRLYSRAIPLLPLRAIRPVQSLSACTEPQCLYRASVPCTPVHFNFTFYYFLWKYGNNKLKTILNFFNLQKINVTLFNLDFLMYKLISKYVVSSMYVQVSPPYLRISAALMNTHRPWLLLSSFSFCSLKFYYLLHVAFLETVLILGQSSQREEPRRCCDIRNWGFQCRGL